MSVMRNLFTKRLNRNVFASFSLRNKSNDTNIIESDLAPIEIPNISIDEFIFSKTHNWPNHIALECGITGRKYRFEEVRQKTRNLSRHLQKKLKLQKNDVIALLLPNCPEFSISALGALKAGLIVTTINPIYTPDEISRQLHDSTAKAIITLAELWPVAVKSTKLITKQIPILTIKTQDNSLPEGAINFSEFLEEIDYPDLPPANGEDVAFLPYSSGTTGLPKGVQLTHRNIVSNINQFHCLGVCLETTKDHQDIMPAVLPKFHIYGLVVNALYFLYIGGKTVDLPKFTPESYVNCLRLHKPDILFVAPPIVLFLTGQSMVKAEDLHCLRTVVSGAAPLGALDEERFLKKASKDINMLQGYGLTETSPVVSMSIKSMKKMKDTSGTLGHPVPNTTIKIVDPNNPTIALGPNQKGELLVKGPQVMKGYLNRPEDNRSAFTEDGWLRTGDIMYYNEDRLLFIVDRLKELIKVKGFQVPPAELEEIIRSYPGIEDTAVIGIPHKTQGEVPRAYIVQKKDANVDLDKLNKFVAEKVVYYKQLKGGIEVVDSIPKNPSGKILRRNIKLDYEKKFGL